jgi:hypothetical protein
VEEDVLRLDLDRRQQAARASSAADEGCSFRVWRAAKYAATLRGPRAPRTVRAKHLDADALLVAVCTRRICARRYPTDDS